MIEIFTDDLEKWPKIEGDLKEKETQAQALVYARKMAKLRNLKMIRENNK